MPSLAVSIPGYTLAKMFGAQRGRSRASLSEMAQSYRGMGSGLMALMQGES